MIQSVTATNYLGERVRIDLADGEPEHGLIVRSMEGLGPAKANISTASLAMNDGSLYRSARLDERNIVLELYFTDSPRIEDARRATYRYFPVKKPVELLIETDGRTVRTTGYVESNEPDIFSGQASCQISILCPDPYFYSAGEDGVRVTIFCGVEPLFEFAFDSGSEGLEFGSVENLTERSVYYEGDSETGVTITVHAVGEAGSVTIYNTGTREVMRIDAERLEALTGAGITAGDDIIISTVRGGKSIRLLRDGIYTNILNCLDMGSDWFQLSKGDNIFAYAAERGSENLQFKIENRVVYEGV